MQGSAVSAGPGGNGVPLADIQRLVLHDSRRQQVRHLLLEFGDSVPARRFLQAFMATNGGLATAQGGALPRFGCERSLGLSFRGLRQLGVPSAYLRVLRGLAPGFAEGAPARAAHRLGDTGASAAERWAPAFALDKAHAVLSLHADFNDILNDEAGRASTLARRHGAIVHAELAGQHLSAPADRRGPPSGRERWVHFGYRDGLSRVQVRSPHARPELGPPHEPGELLLGHENDAGYNPWALGALPQRVRRFFHHASFGVLRQMEQDVAAFEAAVERWAGQIGVHAGPAGRTLEDRKRYIKAKLCGRWPEGHVFAGPDWDRDPAEVAGIGEPPSEYDYAHDPQGLGCPFGSHARRMNPRGAEAVHVRQRPLFRRGMPYGPRYDREDGASAGTRRGLLGLFFCASLEDQFEHLLGQWADREPIGPDDRGNCKDPMIGQHEDARAVFHIPLAEGGAHRLDGFTPFVTTRGTLYTLHLSLPGLVQLLDEDWAEDDEEEGACR